jgi:hypothetical protein
MADVKLQAVSYYREKAQAAVDFVKSKMVLGADNSVWDRLTSLNESRACLVEMRPNYMTEFYNHAPAAEQVKIRALWGEAFGCGNCGEQSAMAYEWLRKNGVTPVENMRFMSGGNHAFVVLGRDPSSDPAKPATWGASAIVCDPWKGEVYPPGTLGVKWPGAVPGIITGTW